MKRIITSFTHEEFLYRGVLIPFRLVIKYLLAHYKEELDVEKYTVHKKFDNETGEIVRGYAFDSIFSDFVDSGRMHTILDKLILEDY